MDDSTVIRTYEQETAEPHNGPGAMVSAGRSRQAWLWAGVKWGLTLLVIGFVGVRAAALWRENATTDLSLHWGWLGLAGIFYTLGWLPSVWFFRASLIRLGDHISWPATVRAYYVGHLGKYVPGKAMVPLIRGQMVATAGGRIQTGALAVVYETLVMMGVAVEMSVAFFPFLIPEHLAHRSVLVQRVVSWAPVAWLVDHPAIVPLATLVLVVVTLPLVARLFSFAARWLAPGDGSEQPTGSIGAGLIGGGALVFVVAWMIQGLALWATLRGVGADVSILQLPQWSVCCALSMAAGFLAIFAPGGIGVREGALIEILKVQPGVDPRGAIAAAFLLRAVGFLAEVIVAIILYFGLARWARPSSET